MAHFNYLKCINGVPASPMEVTLDSAFIPTVAGVTWKKFDADVMSPKTINAVLIGGKVVEDSARKAAYNAGLAKAVDREAAIAVARSAGRAQANPALWTAAQRAIAFNEVPTDAELGI